MLNLDLPALYFALVEGAKANMMRSFRLVFRSRSEFKVLPLVFALPVDQSNETGKLTP